MDVQANNYRVGGVFRDLTRNFGDIDKQSSSRLATVDVAHGCALSAAPPVWSAVARGVQRGEVLTRHHRDAERQRLVQLRPSAIPRHNERRGLAD